MRNGKTRAPGLSREEVRREKTAMAAGLRGIQMVTDLTDGEFAAHLGMDPGTWRNWRFGRHLGAWEAMEQALRLARQLLVPLRFRPWAEVTDETRR